VFWQFWQWVPDARLIFRAGGARRRVCGVRVCGIHVIEGTCQDPHGGFGSYRFSLTGIDVELPLRMAAANRASGGEADLRVAGAALQSSAISTG
jgi:hypothetical protein